MFATIAPLNRVLSVKSPKGGTVYYEYGTNTSTTGTVKIWTVEGGVLKNNNGGTYVEGELYRTKTTDASGKTTEEYKDKLGQVILKIAGGTAKTYYVYDDFGLLRYVLSPEATEAMGGTTYSPVSAEVKGLCYYYEYDGRKRMVKKQLPGAEEVLMVYDARDRLVLVQDGKTKQANSSKWLYTLYDGFNRLVQTGWLSTTKTFSQAQTDFSTVSDLDATSDLPAGYTTAAGDVLTQTFYDTYARAMPVASPVPVLVNNNVKGMVTRTISGKLDESGDIVTDFFYDDKYRVIYFKESPYTVCPDFLGKNRMLGSVRGRKTK